MGRNHRTCILGALEMGGGPRMRLQNAANANSRSSLLRRSLISSEFVTFSSAMHTRSLCCCRILHPSARLITNDSTATNVVGLCTTAFLPVRTHSPYRRGSSSPSSLSPTATAPNANYAIDGRQQRKREGVEIASAHPLIPPKGLRVFSTSASSALCW